MSGYRRGIAKARPSAPAGRQLAWLWIRHQPGSIMVVRRASGRPASVMRQIAIVAVAWLLVAHGGT